MHFVCSGHLLRFSTSLTRFASIGAARYIFAKIFSGMNEARIPAHRLGSLDPKSPLPKFPLQPGDVPPNSRYSDSQVGASFSGRLKQQNEKQNLHVQTKKLASEGRRGQSPHRGTKAATPAAAGPPQGAPHPPGSRPARAVPAPGRQRKLRVRAAAPSCGWASRLGPSPLRRGRAATRGPAAGAGGGARTPAARAGGRAGGGGGGVQTPAP